MYKEKEFSKEAIEIAKKYEKMYLDRDDEALNEYEDYDDYDEENIEKKCGVYMLRLKGARLDAEDKDYISGLRFSIARLLEDNITYTKFDISGLSNEEQAFQYLLHKYGPEYILNEWKLEYLPSSMDRGAIKRGIENAWTEFICMPDEEAVLEQQKRMRLVSKFLTRKELRYALVEISDSFKFCKEELDSKYEDLFDKNMQITSDLFDELIRRKRYR